MQALNDADLRAEVFTVQTIDGTLQQISIQIGGESERLISGTEGNDVLSGPILAKASWAWAAATGFPATAGPTRWTAAREPTACMAGWATTW